MIEQQHKRQLVTPAAGWRWGAIALLAPVALVAASLVTGCGGSSDPATTPPVISEASATIGPAGGTLDGPDGVQVIILPGALAQPTLIGIARRSAGAPAAPTDNPPVGATYEFTPHDLVFNLPVTLRMPVATGAVPNELFMASPGGDWEVVQAVTTAGVAQWQRNSFSWGRLGGFCIIPPNNTDPYPCSYPTGFATASATPASAITRRVASNPSGSAGSWAVNQAGSVNVTLNYRAAPDCGIDGTVASGRVKLIRWNPAVFPRVVQTVFDAVVPLTATPVTVPPGTFSDGSGGPSMRGVGSTTVDISAHLTDAVNAFGFSFSCGRPGKPVRQGGDLLTFIGAMPAPPGPFTVGGTVSGLTGTGLVMQNNAGDNLAVAADATSFAFATRVANGATYGVSVLAQPAGQTCTVQSGSGTVTANVANVAVVCVAAGPGPLLVTDMAAGFGNSLVVASDGTVWAWGYQVDPLTGGYKADSPWATRPVQVQGLGGVKAVALSANAGGAYYALHADGTVSAWGVNTAGALGDRSTTTRALPVKVMQDATTPMDEVCAIAAGNSFLLMARETGCSPGRRAVASGPWIAGFLSTTLIGGDSSASSPLDGAIAKAVPGWPAGQSVGFMTAPDAANSPGAAFFITAGGDRYVWGANNANMLGARGLTFAPGSNGPVLEGSFWTGTGRVELGRDFSVALTDQRTLKAVGRNAEGQLGDGSQTSRLALLDVPTLTGVTDFSVGQTSAAAITAGQLWAWGWNGNAPVTTPTRVGSGTGFTKVVVGDIHSLAIGPGGEVYSWGDSSYGALGRSGSAGTPTVVMRP